MNIQFNHISTWFLFALIVGIILIVIITYYFYKRNKKEFEPKQLYLLTFIRFLVLSTISLLLFGPLLQAVSKTIEKPKVIIGIDNSESMLQNEDADYLHQVVDSLSVILNSDFDVSIIAFGEKVDESGNIDFNDKISDYSMALNHISETNFNQNLSGIILLGDGIYNKGTNPINEARKINAPIYSLATGDTTIHPDQFIAEINHNQSVFLNNSFQLDVDIQFQQFSLSKTRLEVKQGKNVFVNQEIDVNGLNDYQSFTFQIPTEIAGYVPFDISLSPVFNEKNTSNNQKRFYIKVHENKKRVLLLYDVTHPDLGFINKTLSKQPDFDVSFQKISEFNYDYSNYDIITLYQLPNINSVKLVNSLYEVKKPLMLINGTSTSNIKINEMKLGFDFQSEGQFEEAVPFFNEDFVSFVTTPGLQNLIETMPPLVSPFSEILFNQSSDILFYQKLKNIETERPLIFIIKQKERNIGVINGEGIWKWRINEYLKTHHLNYTEEIVVKSYQLLSQVNKQKNLEVKHKSEYPENQSIQIQALVYNDNMELFTEPELKGTLTDEDGNQFNYIFNRTSQKYTLALGNLLPGNYNLKTMVEIGDKTYRNDGAFTVTEVNLEQLKTVANHNMLSAISNVSNGDMQLVKNFETTTNQLLKNNKGNQIIIDEYLKSIIEFRLLFFIILFFLSLEWFLRKFWGSY